MGKNYVENSIKRFLKRKVKITMGFVVAFMIMGTGVFAADTIIGDYNNIKKVTIGAEGYEVDENKNLNITLDTQNKTGTSNAVIDLNGNNLVIEIDNMVTDNSYYKGISMGTEITDTNKENKGNIILIDNSKKGKSGSGSVGISFSKGTKISAGKIEINNFTQGIFGNKDDSIELQAEELTINNAEKGIEIQGNANIESKLVNITAEKEGIDLSNKAEFKIKTPHADLSKKVNISTDTINIKATNKSTGDAINNNSRYSSTINLSAKNITLEGYNAVSVSGFGVTPKQEGADYDFDKLTMEQTGNHVNINADEKIVINGNITIEGGKGKIEIIKNYNKDANYDNHSVNINTDTTKNPDVIINGNIYSKIINGAGENNNVNLRFATDNSKFTGYAGNYLNKGVGKSENANINLEFSNGAEWEAKKSAHTETNEVTSLKLDGGVITAGKDGNEFVNIKVGELSGNGGTLNMTASVDEKGKAQSGIFEIGKVTDDNAHFAVNYQGTDNLEVDKAEAEKVFGELAENIKVENGKFNADAKLEEGFVSREYVSEFVTDGKGNIVVKEDSVKVGNLNSMVEGMRDLATINLLTWRQEMNSLNKRMGELRNSTGEHGVWSRVYTGKIENGSKYDNDYQTYQVGYDKKYTVDNGVMFIGGLVSYTDGETDYALGHGENYSVGAGIYATWLNNDGQFADVVLKQSRLHNKFDVTSKNGNKSQSGDYNNWGTSLSGQYGKRFDLNDKFFLEPSVELTLGRVDDTTYTTSAGVDVHQDTMYSLVGNVGTSVGYKFSDKGNVYARAALVKEFQGDIDTEYEKDGALERTSEDLGDTWAEFGVGVNYRFVENMNVYIDVQKTGEATVDNKWQANLGFRYEF